MKAYERMKATAAQDEYCAGHGLPRFAPKDGYCPRCERNIYEIRRYCGEYATGIDVVSAGSRLITGCPHCGATFCD